MPASPIRKLVPFAEGAKKRGVHVYHLNIGQPDIETPQEFFDAVAQSKETLEGIVSYSHSAGFESLRLRIIDYYARYGVKLGLENLTVTTGGSEAISFGMLACLDPGDEIIIPEPFYANYNGFGNATGVKVVPITTRIEDNFDLPEIEEFEKLITPRTKAILICNPSNPTGKLYSKEDLYKLRDLVKKYDLYLFADEVYREFAYDGHEHLSVLNLEGIEQNAIVVDSISKRFSACGARIGCLVSQNADIISTALKYAQARLSPPSLAQIGAEAVYGLEPNYFDPVIKDYVGRRNALVAALKAIPGVVIPESSGAFYMLVRLPIDDSDKFCQWVLESFDHEGATVMMAPATGFYATPGLGKDEVRIAYVLEEAKLKKAMECLARALELYPGRTVNQASGVAAS